MPDNDGDLRGLRLAVLAPIAWPVPPPGYGPWEQISYNIAAGMRARGLDVTLYASGNSRFDGGLKSIVPVSLNEDRALDGNVFEAIHIGKLFEEADRYDLIHNNFDWKPMTYALVRLTPPMLTTIHGFSQPQILAAYYACAHRSFFTSISDADRDPGLHYLGTTYNGIDATSFTFRDGPGEYLLFLGRFHPEKGTHLAIEIAKRAGIRIKLAGIPHDERYFNELVAPHIDGDAVEFLGEVRGARRDEVLGGATALVHMTTRPERFGLTLVEAMACGTPVLGARMGSIPEIVVDGRTGILCDDIDAAVAAVPQLASIDRAYCRAHVEKHFSIERMVDRYIEAYRTALRERLPSAPSAAESAARAHDWWDRPMAFTDIPPRPTSLRFDEGSAPRHAR